MSEENELSKTMRIDIHPDFHGESLARNKEKTVILSEVSDVAETSRRSVRSSGSPEYTKLLESIYDAVLITDLNGHIRDFNTRAVDMFCCLDEQLSDSLIIDLISGAGESLLAEIKVNLEEERRTMIEAYCCRFDNSIFPAEVAVNQLELDSIGHLCFFVRDVTTRKKVQDALEEAVASLEEHNRAKTQFVSNVSHELRTPLTSMMYAVSNMLRGVLGDLPEKVQRYLHMMEGDCKRMLGTVNDILDLRKMDESTLTLTRSPIEFGGFARTCAESLIVMADQKGVELKIIEGTKKWFVSSDIHKMERVIINLLDNAIKFTSAGGTVEMMVDHDPDQKGAIVLSVRDDGIGIPANALAKVTTRYFTVGEQASGSGLGLAISKEIVDMHGGNLSVISPPPGRENGTLVNIRLPRSESPLVLVVDDEDAIRNIIEGQLLDAGYMVKTAENGALALGMVEQDSPDLVVLDLILPDMHGTDVLLKMKSIAESRRIPVVVITGGDLSKEKAEVLKSFAIPVIVKPWKPKDLLEKISEGFMGVAVLDSKNS